MAVSPLSSALATRSPNQESDGDSPQDEREGHANGGEHDAAHEEGEA